MIATDSCSTVLNASKVVEIDDSSLTPYAVPGAILRYDFHINNPGQKVDPASLVLIDTFPDNVALIVTGTGAFAFTDGTVSSGLSFTYAGPTSTTDSVEFSTDGIDYSYVPTSPEDNTVTHVRFKPTETFAPNNSGSIPSFTISILGKLQ
ncbi:MAG: hypothetical protein V3U57_02690 [Robiginitomaculum sp.]